MLAVCLLALTLNTPQSPRTEEPVVVVGEVHPSPTPSPSPKPKKRPKTEVKLFCSPLLSLSGGITPSLIRATVRVYNPGETLWCPSIEWFVGVSPLGSHESDCTPYQMVVEGEGEPEWWTEDHPRYFELWQGEHTIKAKLVRAGRVLASAECRVLVR
jgi:hypothetical protein